MILALGGEIDLVRFLPHLLQAFAAFSKFDKFVFDVIADLRCDLHWKVA